MVASEPSKRAQIEAKRDVVLRGLALDPAKRRDAVDAALAVRDALQASPKREPAEELEHLARLLGRTRTEKGTRLALKAVVAKYMGLYATDEECWTANGATKGGFKDWMKDFKRFMNAWREAWEMGEISKAPLRPLKHIVSDVDFTQIDAAPSIPIQPVAVGAESLLAVGPAPTVAPTEHNSSVLSTGLDDLLSVEELVEMHVPKCKHNDCDRPRRVKDAAGDYSFCGITCARLHYHELDLPLPLPTCKLSRCELRVCATGGGLHDFCCRSHAREAIRAGEYPPSRPDPPSRPTGWQDPAPREKQCALPGCERHRHRTLEVDHEYCSKKHALAAQMELCSIAKVKQRRRDEP